MAKTKPPGEAGAQPADGGRIQCHWISNTHWDREWRYGAQRVRHILVHMMDMLLDILDKCPQYKYYHLDSQTIPLEDYLQIRPEREQEIREHVRRGRLVIGPWYCLPDEFCVGGESLIRNLLLGCRVARRFGPVSKTGYSPFSWGQISQMPQIYNGFGIDVMSFYRGADAVKAVRCEYIWQGPDGSRLIATRLGTKPRYNVWYLILRRVFWDPKDENDRVLSWNRGRAPFRFADGENCELDYRYAHPEFGYYADDLADFARQAIREQDEDWSTPHRFWSAGHDWASPDIREVDLIADCDEALGDEADVFHSTVEAFHDGIRASVRPDWPVLRGEMRHCATAGSSASLTGWILSDRTYIKQDNFRTERALTVYAEPLAVFAGLLGAPWPQGFIDAAYSWLLKNHGHDSIGGCSRDVVHEDMLYRSRQAREISTCVMEQAMMDLAGAIDLSAWAAEEVALVVYNATPQARSEVLHTVIDIPQQWRCDGYEIVDETGRPLACQRIETISPHLKLVQVPNDAPNFFHGTRHVARVEFKDIPAMGYRTFRVVPRGTVVTAADVADPDLPQRGCIGTEDVADPDLPRRGRIGAEKGGRGVRTGAGRMENEFLAVTVNANGTLDVVDKKTGRSYEGLGYFRDAGEIGSPWEHTAPPADSVLTTLDEAARVCAVCDGELEASLRVTIDWSLPKCKIDDESARSERMTPYTITNTITLRRGQPWVEVVTQLDNTAEDHMLQVCFPTGLAGEAVCAQSQFDVVARPFEKPDPSQFVEPYQTEEPMNSFVDVSDGEVGLALLNEGLKAYESDRDLAPTVRLTLLRCFAMRMFENDWSHLDSGAQCPGRQEFRYAIMPHAGDWAGGRVWQAAERFNIGLLACQIGPSRHGTRPLSGSFLEIEPEALHLSAVKRAESGKGWIVRLFNPLDESVGGKIRLNGGRSGPVRVQTPVERARAAYALPRSRGRKWRKVRIVSLEELPQQTLKTDADGWTEFTIGKKQILTIEFVT